MWRSLVLGIVMCILTGCGVTVTKPPEPTKETTPPPAPEKEIYDKVAPMPREVPPPPNVPRPGKLGGEGNDLNDVPK